MRVLIAEDDRPLAASLSEALRRDGHAVSVVHDGGAVLPAVGTCEPDLILLDRDLPVRSGDEVCRSLVRLSGGVKILMLTAAASVGDRVSGLDLGADDYLTKPFAYAELLARMRALVRRDGPGRAVVLERAGIVVDMPRRMAERDGRALRLTRQEFDLLRALMEADGGWVSVPRLLDQVWATAEYPDRGLVKVAVYALRKKLGQPDPVRSEPGLGYRIA